MLRPLILLLFVIVDFIPLKLAQAIEVKDLYQASVAISSQSSRARPSALKEALGAVMLKVGGEKSVLDNDIIKSALKNHQQYLTQYRYQYKNVRVEKVSENESKLTEKQLFILASFDEQKINNLFQQANLPLWGSLRPQVLLWLIDEQNLTRAIMSNSTDSALPFMVNEFSERRGLPIMMPLMDLTDASRIKLSDIWGRFEQPIREASTRYLAEAIVVMRISNSSLKVFDSQINENVNYVADEAHQCGLLCAQPDKTEQSYVLDWSLISANQTFSQQYEGSERKLLLQQGLADITEVIYQRYALSTTINNDFVLEVANVDSLRTYMDVFNFLSDLSSVKAVTLMNANGESRRFQLQLLGSAEALLASLKLNKHLKMYNDPLADMNNDPEKTQYPVFYWGLK